MKPDPSYPATIRPLSKIIEANPCNPHPLQAYLDRAEQEFVGLHEMPITQKEIGRSFVKKELSDGEFEIIDGTGRTFYVK
ncbi:MAG TPA: hypothetical protein VMD74_02240 [Candidatus Methylomirabilis sp.]|nr:hypothetical protein [Candidatus Methylomirabilis sp.]